MNGEPVPADHGKPVRLAVPGWYGCAWIKWVNEIRLVGPDEPATSQMVEFADRTHQSEPHKLARDYAPADIQTAATPVRVEKRKGPNGLEYRIVGIVWGGTKPVDRLRFASARIEPFDAVRGLPGAEDAHDVVAVGIPLEADRAGHLRHRAGSRRTSPCRSAASKSGYYMRQVSRSTKSDGLAEPPHLTLPCLGDFGQARIGQPIVRQKALVGRARVRGVARIAMRARQAEQRAAAIRRARQRAIEPARSLPWRDSTCSSNSPYNSLTSLTGNGRPIGFGIRACSAAARSSIANASA